MGQILHGNARTTQGIRRDIQNSQESLKKLSKRYGINPKTVAKWRARDYTHDSKMGPKEIRSTVLSPEEEAAIVAFRRYSQLPLDDCLYALQEMIPKLTRSSLHRCFERHGINRLPKNETEKTPKKSFKSYEIGYFHVDIAELATQEGKLYLFVAIDRTSKYAYVELHGTSTRAIATQFLRNLIADVPYKIHTILTDNGIQFAKRSGTESYRAHPFDAVCDEHQIEHRFTQVCHPWTNGQVERMNKTIKEATTHRFYYDTHDQLKRHLHAFLMMYNFTKRLKALNGLSPYDFLCSVWKNKPQLFFINPNLYNVGLNT